MQVDIYKVKKRKKPQITEFLMVESGFDYKKKVSPDELNKLGELIFSRQIEINPGEQRIALNSNDVIEEINKKGFHIETVEIKTTI
ncbi:hypothetical protein [Candidatus Albibeggiatoa sp. nov. BB20]|uniref:hypothetical protein n=1 Tax=Candidatus Albibeggiatoa sp. nov. BB20 TaxID=3162723 RepID=UPI0033655583